VTDAALGHSIIVGATSKPLESDHLCTDGESHKKWHTTAYVYAVTNLRGVWEGNLGVRTPTCLQGDQ